MTAQIAPRVGSSGTQQPTTYLPAMSQEAGLSRLALETEYRTGENNPAEMFYRPCLNEAVEYCRAAGYFRSSVFLIVGADLVGFAKRGGKTRLVCSPALSEEDIDSMGRGYDLRATAIDAIGAEIDRLLADETTHYRTRVLATLIAVGALDVRSRRARMCRLRRKPALLLGRDFRTRIGDRSGV
ncbi:MAG: hypothetical protein FJ247_13535 [Nitrospira sp.]|nr:hypothetical protein [Nitrospira sp.]